jgi:uncharacterized membrane-anchored protein YitT (DUF2179 family)
LAIKLLKWSKIKVENTENKKSLKELFKNYIFLVIGCFITAFASNCILKPSGLSTSGITGLSIVIESITGINYTYIYYVFTLIILIATFILIGKAEIMKIIMLSILYPTLLFLLQQLDIRIELNDTFLVVVFFSLFYGLGVGIVLRLGYSYGGTDTIAKLLHKKVLPFINLSNILLVVDGLILIFTGFILGIKVALYGLVMQFLFTKVVDYVMFGFATELYKHEIISDKYQEISEYIMTNLKRGVTLIDVTGAYTKTKKIKLCCVCSPKQSVDIKKYLLEIDKKAYVEVMPIRSVWGLGNRFKRIDEE